MCDSVGLSVVRLIEETKGANRPQVILSCENSIASDLSIAIQNEAFFTMPYQNILNIVAKTDFSCQSNPVQIMKALIDKISAPLNDADKILLLPYIKLNCLKLPFESYIELLSHFKCCDIFLQLQKEFQHVIQQHKKETEVLQQELASRGWFKPIIEKPTDFEPDIFIAAEQGKFESVQYLIDKEGVDANLMTIKDYENIVEGDTLLHVACQNGHLSIVQYLISKKVNIESKDSLDGTPLHIACQNGHLPIVQYLIKKGASIEANDKDQLTPLHYACQNGHLSIVQFLIEKGANIEAKDNIGQTPIHHASYAGETEIIKYLLSKGANKNPNDKWNTTAYDIACEDDEADKSQIEIIKQLLR